MSGILQTYHPTQEEGRGLHAFTTADHREALALGAALQLRQTLGELLAWREAITASVADTMGEGRLTAAIRDAFAKAELLHLKAGGGHRV